MRIRPPSLSVLTLVIASSFACGGCAAPDPLDAAMENRLSMADGIAHWLDSQARPTLAGHTWNVDARDQEGKTAVDLYSGTPGIVLFYLEHFHQTGRPQSLIQAVAAARELDAQTSDRLDTLPPGLYTGTAGLAYTFAELFRTTRNPIDRAIAVTCLLSLQRRRQQHSEGFDWGPTTDIIAGTAGIGLAMLDVSRILELRMPRELAIGAGKRLLAMAEETEQGLRWPLRPGFPTYMPNFSHGTAGVAYFLARLYEDTLEESFLDGAMAGADHLLGIQAPDGMIYHDDQNQDLFYLGYCHGPPGTARLFSLLARLTDERRYSAWVDQAAGALAAADVPNQFTPGFWNNHGQCCGTAGVVDFYLHLRAEHSDSIYDPRLLRLMDALSAAAVETETGPVWTGAEHRQQPNKLSTQTGYMQGAAGIGLIYLHDFARLRGSPRRIILPDSPISAN